jgi:hypothetical protein
MRMKVLRVLLLVTIILLSVSSVQATKIVLLNYDGDAGFPSITWQMNTFGLDPFSGSAFGLTVPQANMVKTNILTYVKADFALYDINFITDKTQPHDYTWGIDDTAYVFTDGPVYPYVNPWGACPEPPCHRLFGKASNNPGDKDQFGNDIYHPTYSRTWSGSFILGPASADPSSPSLLGHSTGEISQALANNAAHEIAHFFGVSDAGASGAGWNLMYVEVESVESTHDKYFSTSDQAILLAALGPKLISTDTDNDGIIDSQDNCPTVYNPDQLDSNNNGIGDACESIPGIPEFPSLALPATMIIGFLGAVLLLQRTREH